MRKIWRFYGKTIKPYSYLVLVDLRGVEREFIESTEKRVQVANNCLLIKTKK